MVAVGHETERKSPKLGHCKGNDKGNYKGNYKSRNRGSPQTGAAVSSTQMAMIPQRDFELFFSSLAVVTQAPANMRFGIRRG